jgi:hypothetical protein
MSVGGTAWAGQQTFTTPAPVEASLGVTINGIGTDVNARPACVTLDRPCTRLQPAKWGGLGADATIEVATTRHLAITALGSLSSFGYDTTESITAHRPATNVVRCLAIGPTLRTAFTHPGQVGPDDDRFFVQALAGVEDSTIFGRRPILQVGVGGDSHSTFGPNRRHPVIRLQLSYRFSPGAPYPRDGVRAFFGVVFGPHVS